MDKLTSIFFTHDATQFSFSFKKLSVVIYGFWLGVESRVFKTGVISGYHMYQW